MTEDFDFDFDVNRGRSGSRTQDREPDDAAGHGNGRDLPDPETGNGQGSRDRPALDFGFGDYEEPAPRTPSDAPQPESDQGAKRERRRPRANPEDRPGERGSGNGPRAHASRARKLLDRSQDLLYKDEIGSSDPARDDWLNFEEDLDRDLTALREHDDGPAGPPTPGEARNFAKEARRRASRRPSPILDLNEERERRRDRDRPEDADVDFESILEHQPQKSGVARRGSAVRNAVRGGVESLRRVGGERIAESRGRIVALRERVPSRIPAPRPGGGDGKPPPPRLPRRIGSRRPRKPQPGRIKWLRIAIVLVGLGLLGIVSLFFGMMMAISRDLPQLENRKEFAEAQNSEVFDAAGNKIGTLLNNNRRILVESEDISPYMKSATVAIEDERFYEHGGVDIQGMGRALFNDLMPGGSTQGASTITQQFIKNALEAQGNRTVLQKFRESALAYHLEDEWDKDKILTEYLNTVYFGEGAYGIEAAAR
ncbi:MAG TPA: transglycosylase domain-containing protein, partial [Solirubrobacterales bacterium]|nr:transglycosylase domain-containing protein [Solirubrobacterales bacterium]